MLNEAAVRRHISDQRFASYLESLTFEDALRLYEWNIALPAAVYESLHRVEVIVRNALDRELSVWNEQQIDSHSSLTYGREWLVNPAPLLNRLLGSSWEKTRTRVGRHSRTSSRGAVQMHADILVQLPFSAWRFLLPDKDPGRRLLWEQATRWAFPGWEKDSLALTKDVAGLVMLRNRVAHLEPIIRPGYVERQFSAMRRVVGAIDPAAGLWLVTQQRITTVLKARPSPAASPRGQEGSGQP
jgi:hypothetical protein